MHWIRKLGAPGLTVTGWTGGLILAGALWACGGQPPAPEPKEAPVVEAPPPAARWIRDTDSERIRALHVTSDRVWGISERGVVRWQRADRAYRAEAGPLAPGPGATTLVTDDQGWLFVGLPGALAWRTPDGAWHRFEAGPLAAGVVAIAPRKEGGVWLATPTRLGYFTGGRLTIISERFRVRGLTRAPDGRVWAATEGHGVVGIEGRRLVEYTTAQGLCGNSVRTVHAPWGGRVTATCADPGSADKLAIWQQGRWYTYQLQQVGGPVQGAAPMGDGVLVHAGGARWWQLRPLPPSGVQTTAGGPQVVAVSMASVPAPPPVTPPAPPVGAAAAPAGAASPAPPPGSGPAPAGAPSAGSGSSVGPAPAGAPATRSPTPGQPPAGPPPAGSPASTPPPAGAQPAGPPPAAPPPAGVPPASPPPPAAPPAGATESGTSTGGPAAGTTAPPTPGAPPAPDFVEEPWPVARASTPAGDPAGATSFFMAPQPAWTPPETTVTAWTVASDGSLWSAIANRGVVGVQGKTVTRLVTLSLVPREGARLGTDRGGAAVLMQGTDGEAMRWTPQGWTRWTLGGALRGTLLSLSADARGGVWAIELFTPPAPPPVEPASNPGEVAAQATPPEPPSPPQPVVRVLKSETGEIFTVLATFPAPRLGGELRLGRTVIAPEGALYAPLFYVGEDRRLKGGGLLHIDAGLRRAEVWAGRLGFDGEGEDGTVVLPDAWVNGVALGPGGVVYVATNAGLVRKRGNERRVFDENDFIDSEEILDVVVDGLGRVYAGTLEGLGQLDGDRWIALKTGEHTGTRINALFGGRSGLWMGTERGLFHQRAPTEWVAVAPEGEIPIGEVFDIMGDGGNGLWLLTGTGVVRYLPE